MAILGNSADPSLISWGITTSYPYVFNLDTPEVNKAIEEGISLDDLDLYTDLRSSPGANLTGISFPLRYPPRPKLRLGQFYYPTGASRWGEYNGLITSDQYTYFFNAAFAGGTNTAQLFTMSMNGQTIQTYMYLLPLRPLFAFGSNPGLFLATLVDERYYFQYVNSGNIALTAGSTTWEGIINQCAAQCGVAMTIDSVPAIYDLYGPEPDSDFYSNYENAAIMLDAAATNIGMTVVRNYDASYRCMTPTSSAVTIANNQALASGLIGTLAGGDALA